MFKLINIYQNLLDFGIILVGWAQISPAHTKFTNPNSETLDILMLNKIPKPYIY